MTGVDITIVLPVYGRSDLLEPALESVVKQTSHNWELLVADDGSDKATRNFIEGWISRHKNERITWLQRPQNLGLFGNLNQAISEASTEWIMLLCSDDVLLPSATERVDNLCRMWPEAWITLSTFESINRDGTCRPADNAWHHDQIERRTAVVEAKDMVQALLRLGSVNGNLTGMAFRKSLWKQAGPFREDWTHAADWEWLVRAVCISPVILNREPIARVRTHELQLSNSNRENGNEIREVAAVVRQLIDHPLLAGEKRRHKWAAHIMHFQMWNTAKVFRTLSKRELLLRMELISVSAGLRMTLVALLSYVPIRIKKTILGTRRSL